MVMAVVVLFFNLASSVSATAFDDCNNERIAQGMTVELQRQKACACLDGAETQYTSLKDAEGNNLTVKQAYCSIQIAKPQGALSNISALLSGVVQLILVVAGLIAFVFLLLGGIKWITSGGDSANVEKARNQIMQAVIGLIVVFAAWGLMVLIERMTGICLGLTCALDFPILYKLP